MKEVINLKTNNFNKIVIDLVFVSSLDDDFIIPGSLLVRMLTKKTNEFSTEENFSNALIKNYVLDFSFSKQNCANNFIYTYHITIPDKEVLQDQEYKYIDTLRFLKKAIYEPYANKDAFYEEEVNKAKENLKNYIESRLKNIDSYSSLKLDDIIDDLGYFKNSIFKHQDEIDNITGKDLFKYYKSIIQDKNPLIFVVGNTNDDFLKLLAETFNTKEDCTYLPYKINPYKINKDVRIVEERKDYSQSIVKMAYKVKNYTKDDMIMLSLITTLLNSQSSSILSDYLRNLKNLVYTCGGFAYLNHGVLIITAKIYRNNKELTIKAIKDVMKSFKDSAFLEEKLKLVVDRMRVNLKRQKDSIFSNLNDIKDNYFGSYLPLSKEYEMVSKIKVNDIVKFMDRVFLDTIYYLEGEKDVK